MIIANYSPQHGQTGATSNMIAIMSVLALKHNKNILALQSHFKMNNLDGSLIKRSKQVMDANLFDDYGLDSLIRNQKVSHLDKQLIECNCYSFLENRLNLLPGTKKSNEKLYEKDCNIILDILNVAKKSYDFTFIDVNSKDSNLTDEILETADLVLVNLCQNPQVIKRFFESKKAKESKKIFVIGNYDHRSYYNVTNLSYSYPMLKKKDTFPIEYCVKYRDAIWDSDVISFFKKNLGIKKTNKNYRFMQGVLNVVNQIQKEEGGIKCYSTDF